jgi:hypothetical protein
VVTGSEDNTARIWDAATGHELAKLVGHEASVTSIAITPDGSRIITGSQDNTARIWDATNGQELAKLSDHRGSILAVAVTADGANVVTVSQDHTMRIWKLLPYGQALVEDAKHRVPRCLTAEERGAYRLQAKPPVWCFEMRKWPYDTPTLMMEGEALLTEGRLAAARTKFADVRRQDPTIGPEIDTLLAKAKIPKQP